jgi:hypothetical protein
MLCFGFHDYILCIFKFSFYFLVKVEFMVQLKFCNPVKETDFININFRNF